MTLLAIVDYGFIVAFFVGLAVLILVIAGSRSQEVGVLAPTPSSREKTASYGLLTMLFILLIIVTFFIEKNHSPVDPS
ncbi:MAG: hypothetical protein NVS4B11_05440 [Ktedonobacteraceae bacterium]